ncbi:MAG: AraC family transcriptional regulator ligand-binding domain-containing protein [Sphingomonadaceae bacterium]
MEATISSYLLKGFAQLVAERGGDLAAIAEGSGIGRDAFLANGMQIPVRQVLAGFELAARNCDFRGFGLTLAERSSLDVVGPLWPLVNSAGTVRQMLEDLTANFHIYADRGIASLVAVEGGAMLHYDIMAGECESQVQIVEFSLAVVYREICRQVEGGTDTAAFLFRHSRPADLAVHRRVLGPDLRFDQDCNAIFLDSALLTRSCRLHDPQGRETATSRVGELRRDTPHGMARQVEQVIRTCPNLSDCSIAEISARLGLSTRTVQRALNAEGTSFRRVFDHVRADLAKKYLVQSTLGIGQIAELLGYSEMSAFSRAFRRWQSSTATRERMRAQALPS